MKRLLISTSALAVLLFSIPAVSEAEADSAALRMLSEAYAAAEQNLRSGRGTGQLEGYWQGQEDKDLRLMTKAKVNVYFSGKKYHIQLTYSTDNIHRAESRIIITDGKGLFTTKFSKIFKPNGSETEVFPLDDEDRIPRTAGFPFDPCRLHAALIDLDPVRKRYGSSLVVEKLPGGGCTGRYRLNDSVFATFDAPAEAGTHIATDRCFLKNGQFLYQDNKAIWERAGDVWYVKAIELKSDSLNGEKNRVMFSYDSFEPNVSIPDEYFMFSALKVPPGGRILQHEDGQMVTDYRNLPNKESDQNKIDSLLDHLRTLPSSSSASPANSHWLSWPWRVALAAVGLTLSIFGVYLIWRRWRRQGASPPSRSAAP
jgi:hypothetical protein